jgi:hypothetical protein
MKSTKTKTPMKKLSKEQKLRKTVNEQKKQIEDFNTRLNAAKINATSDNEKIQRLNTVLDNTIEQVKIKQHRLNRAIELINKHAEEAAIYRQKYERCALALQVIVEHEHKPGFYENVVGEVVYDKYSEKFLENTEYYDALKS